MIQWRAVPGWERYEVTNTGLVRNRETGRELKPYRLDRNTPRPCVRLRHNGAIRRNARVATLVLEAFVGPRPDDMDCCHNDGDVTNSDLANLRWDTASSNMLDCVKHGTNPYASQTHCRRGHPFNEDNTRISIRPLDGRAFRVCRECRRVNYRASELSRARSMK